MRSSPIGRGFGARRSGQTCCWCFFWLGSLMLMSPTAVPPTLTFFVHVVWLNCLVVLLRPEKMPIMRNWRESRGRVKINSHHFVKFSLHDGWHGDDFFKGVGSIPGRLMSHFLQCFQFNMHLIESVLENRLIAPDSETRWLCTCHFGFMKRFKRNKVISAWFWIYSTTGSDLLDSNPA